MMGRRGGRLACSTLRLLWREQELPRQLNGSFSYHGYHAAVEGTGATATIEWLLQLSSSSAAASQHRHVTTSVVGNNKFTPPKTTTKTDRRRKLNDNNSIRFLKDNVLTDPQKDIIRLVDVLSDDQEQSSLPPTLLENEVVAVLMHLAMHPRKDGGPMASRLIHAVRSSSSVNLTVQMYHLAIECWLKSGVDGAINPAEHLVRELLNKRKELLHHDMEAKDISRVNSSFALVVHTLLRIDEEPSLEKANALIERIRSEYANVECGLQPNATAVNAILNALCHSSYVDLAKQSRNILQEMVEIHRNDPNSDMQPSSTSFAVVIHHLAKVGDISGAKDILRWMTSLHDECIISAKPDSFCFNSILDGLCKSQSRTAVQEIEDILTEMEDIGGKLSPDKLSYTCCINAHARAGNAERAELTLRRMIKAYEAGNEGARPDATSFGACVDAWARVGGMEGAERAEALVTLQEGLYRDGSTEDIAPNVVLYNSLINAWAHNKAKKGGEMAVKVLERMKNFHTRPNTTTYNTILTALARSGSREAAIDKAEAMLTQMEDSGDVPLNVITYNAYLDCLARNSAGNATNRVEETLSRMEKNNIYPNTRTYNTAINLLARSRASSSVQKATEILKMMEASDDESIKPNDRSYGAAINAWSRSSEPNKAEHALDIYKRMKKPSIAAANAVLSACCFASQDEKENAVKIALKVMGELDQAKNGSNPDHITYSTLLKVIGTGLPPGGKRDSMVKEVFERCCAEGHASNLVLKTLTKSASRHLFNELIPTDDVNVPKKWSRNCS